jgi:hypothetical protein
MDRLRQFRHFVLGLVLIAAIGIGTWLLLKSLFSNPSVAGPVIAASAAIVLFAAGEYFTRQRIAQQYRWDKVADTYAEFLHLIRILNEDGESPDIKDFMAKFNDGLILWGSPDVITAWIAMVRATERGFVSEHEPTELHKDLLRAIRKDLGQTDRKLDNRDLLKLLVGDVDDHFDPGLVPKGL